MPVRKPVSHSCNIIGFFPSLKLKRMVAFESLVENDKLHELDWDLFVDFFEEQPRSIPYRYRGELHSYTPDVGVIRQRQHFLLECKPEKFVDSPDNQIKFAAAREWCRDNDSIFEIIIAEQLRAGFRLQNIKRQTMYARHSVPKSVRADTLGILAQEPLPLGQLAVRLTRTGTQPVMSWLLCLGFHHVIEIPVDDGPIDEQTLVSLGGVA